MCSTRGFEAKHFNSGDFTLSFFNFIIHEGVHEGISPDRTASDTETFLLKNE
jgi:hypothetical protein